MFKRKYDLDKSLSRGYQGVSIWAFVYLRLTPGDFLKALALGANDVYIGFIVLIAMLHNQEFKALPFEPPAQLLWYTGRYKNKFNPKKGAVYLANYLRACVEEMRMMTRGLGKTALRDRGHAAE